VCRLSARPPLQAAPEAWLFPQTLWAYVLNGEKPKVMARFLRYPLAVLEGGVLQDLCHRSGHQQSTGAGLYLEPGNSQP
jgi:hypothetical protein